jgi:hypothetical protein
VVVVVVVVVEVVVMKERNVLGVQVIKFTERYHVTNFAYSCVFEDLFHSF